MVMTKTMGFKWQQKQKGRAKNNLYFRPCQDKGQWDNGQWDNGTMEKKQTNKQTKNKNKKAEPQKQKQKIGRVLMNRANNKK